MIQNVVFVLGAGASCPYGFPSGKDLREQIIDHHVADCENYLSGKRIQGLIPAALEKANQFVKTFDKAPTKSIDLFLAWNPEFSEDGRRAIVFRILAAERASGFGQHSRERDQDWYSWLFMQMTDELVKKDDYSRFSENDLSIITFNYDRSLEHFLYESLSNSFNGIAREKVIEQLNHITICHVFEPVAPLEWQGQPNAISYGTDFKQVSIDVLAKNIRIIHDKAENPRLREARNLLSKADRVFFLGFGYARENLEALGIPDILADVPRVCGTALGFTEKDIEKVKSRLRRLPAKPTITIIENCGCLALLREYL